MANWGLAGATETDVETAENSADSANAGAADSARAAMPALVIKGFNIRGSVQYFLASNA